MPERDITGRAADRASRVLFKALARIKTTLPLGPGQVKMTRTELRKSVEGMRPELFQVLLQQLGPERLMAMLQDKEGQVR